MDILKLLLILTIFFRMALLTFPSFEYDESNYRVWTQRLMDFGPSKFYSTEVFTNNPLGYLYIFWVVGLIKNSFLHHINYISKEFDILLKTPATIADILSGLLIYFIVRKFINYHWALLAFILYVFNPTIFFNSSVWGQYDSFSTLFLLLSSYSLIARKKPEISTLFFAISWVIKPQALVFAPIFILMILKFYNPSVWIKSALIFLVTSLVLYFPFFPKNPIAGLIFVNSNSANLFNCTSCFAFNFWGVFGNWQNDLQKFLGFPLLVWGTLFLLLSYVLIFIRKSSLKFNPSIFYLTSAISFFAFFTFLTRMHERYLFPFFSFFLIASCLLKSRKLALFYVFISVLSFLNLYLPYAYYNKYPSIFLNILLQNFSILSLVSVICFLLLLIYSLKREKN